MSAASHLQAAEIFSAAADMRVTGLACRYGPRPVFDSVSFELKAGAALALYGANGSGKTSLLRIIAGLLPPVAGTIDLPPSPQSVHYLGHMDGLKPLLTVGETLSMMAGFYGVKSHRENECLSLWGCRAAQRKASVTYRPVKSGVWLWHASSLPRARFGCWTNRSPLWMRQVAS